MSFGWELSPLLAILSLTTPRQPQAAPSVLAHGGGVLLLEELGRYTIHHTIPYTIHHIICKANKFFVLGVESNPHACLTLTTPKQPQTAPSVLLLEGDGRAPGGRGGCTRCRRRGSGRWSGAPTPDVSPDGPPQTWAHVCRSCFLGVS